MPSPGGQFLSDEFGDIEDYFISDYQLIDQYIGDQLWTWGLNNNVQLGINATGQRNTPINTFTGINWKSAAGGNNHTAAIKTDGTLWVWGGNDDGQLGINTSGTTEKRSTPVTTFAGETNWKSVACGRNLTAAIKTDGTLWVWGRNYRGQLGTNQQFVFKSTPVTTFAGGNNWKSVSCGEEHTAAIKTDGTLWVWGLNDNGQLGINNTTVRNTPVTTFAGGNNWKSVIAGGFHTAAIKTDGTLWTWGYGGYGQLGNNTTGNFLTPVTTFAGGNNWKSVSCGQFHTVAIKTDGTLWTWGRNDFAQLGINVAGTTENRTTPVTTFAGGTNWKQIAVSGNSDRVSAIKTDGTLWVWGRNTNGQLGINNAADRSTSTPVTTFAGGTNWKFVGNGVSHTIAIPAGLNVDFS